MTDHMTNYVQGALDALNKRTDVPPELARLYALLALVKGEDTTLEDVHDAWAIWANIDRPHHKSLVPFDMLTEDVQELDEPYRHAIVQVAFHGEAVEQ